MARCSSFEWLEYGRGAKKNDGISVNEIMPVNDWDNSTPIERDEVEIPFYSTIELAAGFGSCTTDNQKGELLRSLVLHLINMVYSQVMLLLLKCMATVCHRLFLTALL